MNPRSAAGSAKGSPRLRGEGKASLNKREMLHRVLGPLAYPAVIGMALALAWSLYGRGLSPSAAVSVSGLSAGVAVLLLQFLIPYRKEWQRSHGDVRTDFCHFLMNNPVVGTLTGILVIAAAIAGAKLSNRFGVTLWPKGGSPWLHLPATLLVAEFFSYWFHRLQHESNGFLWRIHAVHHSAPRLYVLNAFRFHPIDTLATGLLMLVPLVLLGVSEPVMVLASTYMSAHLVMQHSNVDVRLGPLNWVFSMAEVHRWHHSMQRSEMNANYGGVLLVWDVVFGTRFFPRDRTVEPEDVAGLDTIPDYPTGWLQQILSPFRRRLWDEAR